MLRKIGIIFLLVAVLLGAMLFSSILQTAFMEIFGARNAGEPDF